MKVLFILLLFSMLSFAQTFNFEPYLYLEENESSVEITSLSNGYELVSISGEKTFILFENQIVEDAESIQTALREYYIDTALPSDAELDEVRLLVRKFNETRNLATPYGGGAEDVCVAYSYLSMYKGSHLGGSSPSPYCYNYETCSYLPVITGITEMNQIPWFIEVKAVHGRYLFAFDNNLTEFEENLNGIELDNAADKLQAALENLEGMKRASNMLKQSALQLDGLMGGACNPEEFTQEYIDEVRAACPDEYRDLMISAYPQINCMSVCPDVSINLTKAENALSKVQTLLDNALPLANVESEAAQILEKTAERKNYVLNIEKEKELLLVYENVTAELDHIHTITNVTALRNTVLNDIVTLEVLVEQINTSIATGNFELAEQLVDQFRDRSRVVNSRLDRTMPTYTNAQLSKEWVERELLRAQYNIGESEFEAQEELDEYMEAKYKLDARFSSTTAIDDFVILEENYTLLGERIASMNDGLENLHASQISTLLSSATRSAMKGSLSLWNSFSPMTPAEKQQNARMMPALIIGTLDLIVVLLSLGIFLFFAFVKKRIVWKRQVTMIWAVIFVVFFALVGAASLGAYELVQRTANEPTSFGLFYSGLAASNSSAVTYDASNLTQMQLAALQSCSDKIISELEDANITAQVYVMSGDACRAGDESKTLEECNAELADIPHFTLNYGIANRTSFLTFYEYDAVISGDTQYIEACEISKVL